MKYPFVLFYRLDKYSYADKFFIDNSINLDCTIYFISKIDKIKYLYDSNYQILITFGNKDEYHFLFEETLDRFKNKWHNFMEIPDIQYFNKVINELYIKNCIVREYFRPIFSIFTTTYNSYNKIMRAYNSLKKQKLRDWEWVIVDDSPDDRHFDYLKNNLLNDKQIRLYRRSHNSGNIGNVKNEAVSLCRGKYILELDHDDEILPDCLYDAEKVFDNDPSVGFIYMDFINIYENGENFTYGDHICYGYGGYYCQKYDNVWRYVYITPNVNNITLSYLICCPNHPRIWRRELLNKLDNYCEFLPICDDYEILLKTALNTKIVKIPKLAYIQYMNDNNNNFSLIRNSEINRIGPKYISPIYYEYFNINNRMRDFDAYEDEKYLINNKPIWLRDYENPNGYKHKYCNLIINNDYKKQYCIIGIDSLLFNIERIKDLYNDKNNDFIVIENKCDTYYLSAKIDYYGFERMKIYSFIGLSNIKVKNYFMLMYRSVEEYEIIDNNNILLTYNCDFINRHDVINNNTDFDIKAKYLEIGTENGFTFKNIKFLEKNGVDPDPKYKDDNIIVKTSDNYFDDIELKNENILSYCKDIFFIDGMHLCDYVIKDYNNCIKYLNENGVIFIDDIMPINYDEQLRIPNKHYYENNILKYGEPWTGDVWKFIYFILLNFKDRIFVKVFHNQNYRGIIRIQPKEKFQINELFINEIKNYDYFKEINNYLNLLNEYIN
jgi:glycosyltransferase involved in cell wall biosynthesis